MSGNDQFRTKPDPGQNLSGKIFASGNSPHHVDSKYVLFKKPDYWTKNRNPESGKFYDQKNYARSSKINIYYTLCHVISLLHLNLTSAPNFRTETILRELHIIKIWSSKN